MRAQPGLPSLRRPSFFAAIRAAIAAANQSPTFRVIHFSVQSDHLHLLVEAHDKRTLSEGARGLAVRTARAVNRLLRRHGRVWGDRYHTHALETPREVRHALVYVLFNVRKHQRGWDRALDPRSSAPWFDGFSDHHRRPPIPPPERPVIAAPTTWLARLGWRRRGLIALHESPKRQE